MTDVVVDREGWERTCRHVDIHGVKREDLTWDSVQGVDVVDGRGRVVPMADTARMVRVYFVSALHYLLPHNYCRQCALRWEYYP
jgi:hypothetical protein